MQIAAFNAKCPFEIGDKIISSVNGEVRVITDILTMHYIKSGKIEFAYELDNDGRYGRFNVKDWGNKQCILQQS